MAEESIETLRAQIASLSRENQRLVAENTKRKLTNRDLQSKLTTATADLTQSAADLAGYKKKAEKNTDKGSENEEIDTLRTQVRSYKHRQGFEDLAYSKEIGLNRSIPVDRLMRLIDYKPVDDEFDAKATKKLLLDLKESDSYLFGGESAGGTGQRPNGAALNPAVAGLGGAFGRGSAPNSTDDEVIPEENLRDPQWMSQHHARQRAAHK